MFYRTFRREAASVLFKAAVTILTVIFFISFIESYYSYEQISDGSCNIAVMPVEGIILPFVDYDEYELVTTPGFVRDFIATSEQDPNILGLLVEVNSPGGAPVASEQIANLIHESTLPSISIIGDIGASGGYLAAAGANRIIASPMSDVGSIGVTMSYTEQSKKNEEEGITFVPLSTGEFKDAGSPEKPLTEAERARFEADLEVILTEFIKSIAFYRNTTEDAIRAFADGGSMPGVRAKEVGLVDELGGRKAAREAFSATLGIAATDLTFCEYEPLEFFY